MMSTQSVSMSRSASKKLQGIQQINISVSPRIQIFFDFYEILFKFSFLPNMFYKLFFLFYYMQNLLVSFWIPCTAIWFQDKSSEVIHYLTAIFIFQPIDSDYIPSFIAFIAVSVIILIIFLVQILSHKVVQHYHNSFLQIIRLIIELFPLVMVHPLAFLVTRSLNQILHSDVSAKTICCTLFSFIFFLFIIILFFINYEFMSYSPYLGASTFSALSFKPLIIIGIANPVFALLSGIIEALDGWAKIALSIVHILPCVYFIILMLQRPFTHLSANVIFLQLGGLLILNDIIVLIFSEIEANSIYIIYIDIALIVLGFIASYLVFHFQHLQLDPYFENEMPSEDTSAADEKATQLRELMNENIKVSKYKAILYLFYSIDNNAVINSDFHIIKTIISAHQDPDTLILCTKIVTFFPLESRLLNFLTTTCTNCRNLNLNHRFLLHQLNHVRIVRQTSTSVIAASKLRDMKTQSKDFLSQMISYWEYKNMNLGMLRDLKQSEKRIDSLWLESLHEYPNSVNISNGYCNFLIECSTDFSKATVQKHRTDLIENGKNFSIDRCYSQFVRNYPSYLIKGYIDKSGGIISKQMRTKAEKASQSSSNLKSDNSFHLSTHMSSLDNEMEEGIANALFVNARMRLALQTATNTKKLNGSPSLLVVTIWILIVTVFSALFLLFYFFNVFDNRISVYKRIELLNNVDAFYYGGIFGVLMEFATKMGLYDDTVLSEQIGDTDDDIIQSHQAFFDKDPQVDWSSISMAMNVQSRKYYSDFLIAIAELATTVHGVYELTGPLLEIESVNNTFCSGGHPLIPQPTNLQVAYSYQFATQACIIGNDSYSTWFTENDDFCSMLQTSETICKPTTEIRERLMNEGTDSFQSVHDEVLLILSILPAVVFVVCFIPFLISIIRLYKEMRHLWDMMLSFDNKVKHEAMCSMKTGNELDVPRKTEDPSASNPTLVFVIIFILTMAIFAIVIFVMLHFIVSEYNKEFQYADEWIVSSLYCKVLVLQIAVYTIEDILITDSPHIPSTEVSSSEKLDELLRTLIKYLFYSSEIITRGTDSIPAAFEYDDRIGFLIHTNRCDPVENLNNIHEQYRCSSIENMMYMLNDLLTEILIKIKYDYKGVIDKSKPLNAIHLIDSHLLPRLDELTGIFESIITFFDRNYKMKLIVLSIVLIVLSIFLFTILLYISSYYNSCFQAAIILLRRVNPVAIVSNKELIDYILDRNDKNDAHTMSTAQSVIHNSSNGIVCMSSNGVIETINIAVTTLLGYTPEQLIGQMVTILFEEADRQKILSQLVLIKNKQNTSTYEDHSNLLDDKESAIPCMMTIIGMEGSDNTIKSFVLILTDETELLRTQQEAEEAKKNSEELLFHILPPEIVLRINQGEKDISFTVPSSTIIFVDIVKFSDYVQTLTPKETMENLSIIFGGYDDALAKFNLLLKIKLIGDVYMAAGGLFDPDSQPQQHAEQMILFAFQVLQVIEELNMKFNSVLSVRIGINTGGPLIAGVLGTDKPVFDIIGDPINIAARLQSTDIPENIQISEDTYELIKDNEMFNVEPRGEIFLKGKGKRKTYLVHQSTLDASGNSFQLAENPSFIGMSDEKK